LDLENIGQSEIYNRLTQETITISNSAPLLVLMVQSGIMLFFVSIYIFILSRIAFLLIFVLLVSAVLYYLHKHKKVQSTLVESNQAEMAFFETLTDILEGIKEIKLNRKRSSGLVSHLKHIIKRLKNLKITIAVEYMNNNIFAQSFYYLLIGVIVFILPRLYPTYTGVLAQLVTSILFMVGPVNNLVGAAQTFDQVDFAVANIYRLEEELGKISEVYEDQPRYNNRLKHADSFDKICLENLEFSYKDPNGNDSFSIGPFNFHIKTGDTVFIVGGNGSGKTTLLKVLCMLYYPDNGSISLDDMEINPDNAVDYRELFSTVFSDFHLFSRLHGMEDVKREKVEKLLKRMEISHKTKFLGDKFSTIDLSTGQRKRLALLVSLLEDKPVYIFDEWAADQDPGFRKYFYEHILKELKEKGKTIIAASHDDRFFEFADRIIKLEYGKVVEKGEEALPGFKRFMKKMGIKWLS
jgi:putative ATP-binding cassette transporter